MATKKAAKAQPVKESVAKNGRPTIYSDAIVDAICRRLESGESLRSICEDESMPSRTTVNTWLCDESMESFRTKYVRAREAQADYLAEEIIAISDEVEVETKFEDESVTLALSATAVARNRLRMDARKWYASKLAPKKYGDRQAVDLNAKVEGVSVSEEQAKRIAEEVLRGVSG